MQLVPSKMVAFVTLGTRSIDTLEVSATIETSFIGSAVDALLKTLVNI